MEPAPSFVTVNGVRLHYRIDGRADAPWLLFCNSLGTDLTMWDRQIAVLGERFHILRYDRRGHGCSAIPAGPYSIEMLGRDVLGLLDALGIERTHFCGLSIGGLVGQWLALHVPQRLDRLALCSTAAKIGSAEGWRARIDQVREHGMASIAEGTVSRWFTPAFAAAEPTVVTDILGRLQRTSVEGYAGCCAALIDADFRGELDRIGVPTMALAGHDDPVTTPADLRWIAAGVVMGSYAEVDGRHICNLESAAAFNSTLGRFLTAV
ncbi:3-oxoadipate enol-lactonase [Rhodanobacter sp. C03]|uniref:3-oxoadipate enol-lactonase n=1 Tax=Rhodanobacter sp. C03 TaxID=1945858 RepID=UPI0009861E25|nr:3-oxoadipate enol-lactonase [Rhodanobacter sp. C03]OOG55472.1 3-oxoadipate enol-lactonase [Rhodanobacter sp. C03]